jgi:hypothetical protein
MAAVVGSAMPVFFGMAGASLAIVLSSESGVGLGLVSVE